MIDPLEEMLPEVGRVSLEDAETGEIYEVNTSDARVRTEFARAASARREVLGALLRRARVDSIDLRTDRDYLPALRAFFLHRERRIARG